MYPGDVAPMAIIRNYPAHGLREENISTLDASPMFRFPDGAPPPPPPRRWHEIATIGVATSRASVSTPPGAPSLILLAADFRMGGEIA